MNTIARALWNHWNKDRNAEVQIALRGVPLMRGKLTCLNQFDVGLAESGGVSVDPALAAPVFELEVEAQEGHQKFILPVVFAAEDVAWFSGGPRKVEQPSIITPGGGLQVGGGGRA